MHRQTAPARRAAAANAAATALEPVKEPAPLLLLVQVLRRRARAVIDQAGIAGAHMRRVPRLQGRRRDNARRDREVEGGRGGSHCT
jgi:hypothetical protein